MYRKGLTMKMTMSRLLSFVLLTSSLLVTGCATRTKMAFEDAAEKLTPTSNPVFLMTTTLKNNYRNYQPDLLVVGIEKPGAKEAADRFNFTMDEKALLESDKKDAGKTYLLRFQLPAGEYDLVAMRSLARSFPIVATFLTPIQAKIKANSSGVYYLGHISATVRERKDNEFKAGPTIPLLDQALAGASGGTFDVVISDEWATYEKIFKSTFPALANVEVKKEILPPFDRQKAQKWWESL
jgi:hypothetical protein